MISNTKLLISLIGFSVLEIVFQLMQNVTIKSYTYAFILFYWFMRSFFYYFYIKTNIIQFYLFEVK